MRRPTVIAALALALAALGAGEVGARYEPRVSVELSPTTPGSAPAVTASLTQADGEAATRSVSAQFPAAFSFNPRFAVVGCSAAAEAARRCPDASRIGRIDADTPFGRFAGSLHLTHDYRLWAHVVVLGGLIRIPPVTGALTADRGGYRIVFDGLPNVPMRALRVSLAGGQRSLLLAPRACGTYEIATLLTGHDGSVIDRRLPIAIGPCRSSLRIVKPRIRPKRVRRGRAALLRWRLREPGRFTRVTIQRRGRGGWRVIARRRASAKAGTNRLRLRVRKPGRYRLVLRAYGPGGARSTASAVRLRVR